MLIDTHAHLDDERFVRDLPDVLTRAQQAGVEHIIAVATTAQSSRACVQLASMYPLLAASAGIHPNHYAESVPGDWDVVLHLANDRHVVAVGETGLDRHWNDTPFERQEENLARHLELSRSTGKPLIIHSRECDADMLRMLSDDFTRHGALNGVMHSFSSGTDIAEACLAMGLYVSFAGMVTYKNAAELRAVAAMVPADRLLVETDCPYLAPVPVRGQRNEPAFVAHTARLLAEVRGVPFDDLATQTTTNAKRLFGI